MEKQTVANSYKIFEGAFIYFYIYPKCHRSAWKSFKQENGLALSNLNEITFKCDNWYLLNYSTGYCGAHG